jgi:hypothetical protein
MPSVGVIQKDAAWNQTLPFAQRDRILGLDPETGERRNLISIEGHFMGSPLAMADGGLLFTLDYSQIGRTDSLDSLIKEYNCISNPAHLILFDERTVYSDTAYWFSDQGTGYDLIDLESEKMDHYDLSFPYFCQNHDSVNYHGKLCIFECGVESAGRKSALHLRDLLSGEETTECAYFSDHPYSEFQAKIVGDILYVDYYDEGLIERWSIPDKTKLASLNTRELLSDWANAAKVVLRRLFYQDGTFTAVYIAYDSSYNGTGMALIRIDAADLSARGTPLSISSPDDYNNTSVNGLSGGLLFCQVEPTYFSDDTYGHIDVFNAETGALVRQEGFVNQ